MITAGAKANKINNISDLRAYFEQLTKCRKDVNYFIFGNEKDLLSALRTRINYPCLLLYLPQIQFKGSRTNPEKWFDIKFRVFTACYRDSLNSIFEAKNIDFESDSESEKVQELLVEIQTAFVENEQIIEQFALKISKDFRLPMDSFQLTPVQGFTADYSFGWECEFSLFVRIPCASDGNWDENCA